MFILVGTMLRIITDSNNGLPPIVCSWDLHGSHFLLKRAFVGLVPHIQLQRAPFFRDCTNASLAFPLWGFGGLVYKPKQAPMCGADDTPHFQGRFAVHTRGGQRKSEVWGFFVGISNLRKHGLPIKAMIGSDVQSNKQAAQLLNSGFNKPTWDNPGILLWTFFESMVVAGWRRSPREVDIEETCENAFSGYYCMLLTVFDCIKKYGRTWETHCLPRVTLQNMCFQVAFLMFRLLYWPEDCPWLPNDTLEKCMEYLFGMIKRFFHGTPNLKDLLLGSHLTVLTRDDMNQVWKFVNIFIWERI